MHKFFTCVLAGLGFPFLANAQTLPLRPDIRLNAPPETTSGCAGGEIAVSGDIALSGRPGIQGGVVCVFVSDGAGRWYFSQHIADPEITGLDTFGQTVALAGNAAIIGDGSHSEPDADYKGRVYVYEYAEVSTDGGGYELAQTLVAPDGRAGDFFGYRVAVESDILAIGAFAGGPELPSGIDADGAVYIYQQNPASRVWEFRQKFSAPERTAVAEGSGTDDFGWELALSGGRLLVGAPAARLDGVKTGAAFVYGRNPSSGAWELDATLKVEEAQEYWVVGHRVALRGNLAALAAYAPQRQGRVYLFERNPDNGSWSQVALLNPPASSYGGEFASQFGGFFIASDHEVLVGDVFVNSAGVDTDGVHVYSRNPASGAWSLRETLTAPYPPALYSRDGDAFGGDIASSGDTLWIGAGGGLANAYVGSDLEDGYGYGSNGVVWQFKPGAPMVDLGLQAQAYPARPNEPFSLRMTISNLSAVDKAPHPVVSLPLPAGLELVQAPEGCAALVHSFNQTTRVVCERETDLAPGEVWRPELRMRAAQPGTYPMPIQLAADRLDSAPANNTVSLTLRVDSPSSGGGGVLDSWLVLLGLCAALRDFRDRRNRDHPLLGQSVS